MSGLLRVLVKRALVAAGVLVIALALLLGAARLLIGHLPGYQDELRAWVTQELGVEASFAALDARLGLYGPELDLRDVSLRAVGTTRDFLDAAQASLTLDPWALVLGRRVAVSRLTLQSASLGIERSVDGAVRVQGLTAGADAATDYAALLPESVVVAIRDSQVLYIDRAEQQFWQFADVDIELTQGSAGLTATARARPPETLADRIELTASRGEHASSTTLRVALTGVDLAEAVRLIPSLAAAKLTGEGDVDFTGAWRDGRLVEADAAVTLARVSVVGDSATADYDRLAFAARWSRVADMGYAVSIDGLELSRDGRDWPGAGSAMLSVADGGRVVGLSAGFLRLEDLGPLVARLAPADFAARWAALRPRGDLDSVELGVDDGPAGTSFTLETAFTGLAVAAQADWPGFVGLDGEVRAGTDAGTISLSSAAVGVDWPTLFDATIRGSGLRGTLVWRRGQDGLTLLSDDLRVDLFGEQLVANFEVELPDGVRSPYLDLHGRLARASVADARTLLPRRGLPDSVVRWLQTALLAGAVQDVTIDFTGALADFPFDDGNGRFLVEADAVDTAMEFVPAWPRAEELAGRIRFENAGFDARGAGRILDTATDDLRVTIADMRDPLLQIDANLDGPLGDVLEFVQTAPLIARHLGPGFERLHADSGIAGMALDLDLPLKRFGDFELFSRLDIADGTLRIDGFAPEATEINGGIEVMNSNVAGEGIGGVFLGGPVVARVAPATAPGYRTVIEVSGETTADAVFDAFSLPLGELVDGQTLWTGRLLLPRTELDEPGPLAVEVESNLSGVALRFPDPLTKPPGEPVNMRVAFVFQGEDALSIAGNLGATRRFELLLAHRDESFALSRGAIAFGGADPLLPLRDGIVVDGRLARLKLDDWIGVARNSSVARARPLFYSADLEIAEFDAFGQQLGATTLDVQRGDRVWDIRVDSAAIAGDIEVPQNLASRAPVIADMERVYLAVGDAPGDPGELDPRDLPGLRVRAAEFGFGPRELGRVEADVVADPRGLRLTSFVSSTDNYSLEASGSWLADGDSSTSRIAATVTSSDVAATLDQLGIDPVVEGESGELTASVYWEGPPSSRWLDHLNGDVALRVDTGSLIEIDPGAGRVVGLMSIAALPRRLMLDFRDVFNKGFSFDEITGSFAIEDGNAYTDNLKLSGPAAEIGVIGRTGLRDRDYQQQAVITAEPSNMLPTVGGLLAGAGVGAALLIFTRIFKEPLKGIGRASYCVTGTWDAPNVERLGPDRTEGAEECVALPELLAGADDGG